ncbi:MAG: hypothetical protein P1U65_15840 [Minwuia sp.]|nr:hypothetical protein [Minwuia sp.]
MKTFGRPHRFQQAFKLSFDHGTTDRLAIAITALLRAKIIGMPFAVAPFRPTGREERFTIAADDAAAQREVRRDILAHRRTRFAVQALLDELIGLKADERRVQSFTHRHVPAGCMDMPCVDDIAQNILHPLIGDSAILLARELRMPLEEAQNFDLKLEAP